jgi:PIN domain nuclease of toxin-antitoxin system
MKILIDTHVFLWGIQHESKLSPRVRTFLPVSDVLISVAKLWEIIAKVQTGKLALPGPIASYLTAKLKSNGVSVLPFTFDHVKRLEELPLHHRDPLDRILMAQGLEESLPIVTADPQFVKYSAELIW